METVLGLEPIGEFFGLIIITLDFSKFSVNLLAKLPKMTDFFKITEQSRPGTSTERDEENYSVQEKEDYDDQHQSDCEFPENVSCDLPANTQPSI